MIADRAWPNFIRGDHDTAVFQAFKAVEVAVRQAAGGVDAELRDKYGTDLMRAAFHDRKGPLTDKHQSEAERQSLAHLFHGAIGSYKNPCSHRTVVIKDAVEAVELRTHGGAHDSLHLQVE